VVTPETYVWKDGMADWAPLSQMRPAMASAESCTICGKAVGADNLIDLLGNRVCAVCKPMAVQSLKEGAGIHSKTFTAWRDGKRVVAFDKTVLPARCFRCNHDSVGVPMKRKLSWHPALYFALIFVNLFIYVIVAILVRKRATLDIFLCEKHRSQRKMYIIGAWSSVVVGTLVLVIGGVTNTGWMSVAGILVIVAAIVASVVGVLDARAVKIKKDGSVWLRGAGKEFLASLPDWTGNAR
jgi:hypothetical protein